jgi:hypothetical protein
MLITADNLELIRDSMAACDQAGEIYPGCITWGIKYEGGQRGQMTIYPDTGRAAVAFGGDSIWGDWDARNAHLVDDDGRRLDSDGQVAFATVTAAEIVGRHALDIVPYGYDESIRDMLEAEPDTDWIDYDQSYIARRVGDAGPVVLTIYRNSEPGWETEATAEETLAYMGILDDLRVFWDR